MKERGGFYHFALLDEGEATFSDSLVKFGEGLETAVGEGFVDECPKMFGGLQFGAVRGLKDETEAVGNGEVFRAMPTGVVELQDDPLVLAGADRFREIRQHKFKQLFADRV